MGGRRAPHFWRPCVAQLAADSVPSFASPNGRLAVAKKILPIPLSTRAIYRASRRSASRPGRAPASRDPALAMPGGPGDRARAAQGQSAQGGRDVVRIAVEIQRRVARDAYRDAGEPVAGPAHAAGLQDRGGEAGVGRRVPAAVGYQVVAGSWARRGEGLL